MGRFVTFKVRGGGVFPFDMLRYDGCWPKHASDVVAIQTGLRGRARTYRTVTIEGTREPTTERWASFGWEVVS